METLKANKTSSWHKAFTLFPFPGVTRLRPLLAIPLSFIYAMILASNSVVMTIIVLESCLHSPMYMLILSLLSVSVLYTTAMIPKTIATFLGFDQITLTGCLVQIFTVYTSITTESTLLMVMAVDRYLAISQPLQYWQIITKHLLVHFSINTLIRVGFVVIPLLCMISRLHYCNSNTIIHFHCENTMLFDLGCDDIAQSKIVALIVRTTVSFCDICIILLSYLKVFHTVMKIAVGAARKKALSTCSTHLVVAGLMYITGIISVVLNLPDAFTSYNLQNIFSAVYYLLPVLANPFIFGFWMKDIRDNLMKYWKKATMSLQLGIH